MTDPTDAIREALPDRFKIVKEIGRGGMATVYLAEEQHPKRTVAVKVLNPELGARLGRDRFVREVEMLSNLNHPHNSVRVRRDRATRRNPTVTDRVYKERAPHCCEGHPSAARALRASCGTDRLCRQASQVRAVEGQL